MEASRWIRPRAALHLGALACAAALLPAASASAAYAPQLAISFNPSAPGKPTAITSILTQQAGETPSRTIKVSFPVGFGPNAGAKATICQPDPNGPLRCPSSSQIGTAKATASAFGLTPQFDGFVYFGGPVTGKPGTFQLLILLLSDQFGEQSITGLAQLRPDGGYDNIFDNLPNVLITSFTLALDGGDLALLQTPQQCGSYQVTSQYTSQTGEQAGQTVPFAISGCVVPARVGTVGLSRSGVVSFALSAPSRVTITVSGAGKRVKRRTVSGRKGTNRIRMGRLRPGRYAVTVASATGNSARRTVKIG